MLIMSYIGDQVWLMTSRQTEPDLDGKVAPVRSALLLSLYEETPWMLERLGNRVFLCCKIQYSQLVYIRMEDAVREADAR